MRPTTFPTRAVNACVDAMTKRVVSPRHVKNVLKYDNVDVTPIEPFLNDQDDIIRQYAVQIIGEKGDVTKLIESAKAEKNSDVLMLIMRYAFKSRDGLDELVNLLDSKVPAVREEAIKMFRRAERTDLLFCLLFDSNDELMVRIRDYINNAENAEMLGGTKGNVDEEKE